MPDVLIADYNHYEEQSRMPLESCRHQHYILRTSNIISTWTLGISLPALLNHLSSISWSVNKSQAKEVGITPIAMDAAWSRTAV